MKTLKVIIEVSELQLVPPLKIKENIAKKKSLVAPVEKAPRRVVASRPEDTVKSRSVRQILCKLRGLMHGKHSNPVSGTA